MAINPLQLTDCLRVQIQLCPLLHSISCGAFRHLKSQQGCLDRTEGMLHDKWWCMLSYTVWCIWCEIIDLGSTIWSSQTWAHCTDRLHSTFYNLSQKTKCQIKYFSWPQLQMWWDFSFCTCFCHVFVWTGRVPMWGRRQGGVLCLFMCIQFHVSTSK